MSAAPIAAPDLGPLPEALRAAVAHAWDAAWQAASAARPRAPDAALADELVKIWACSPFLARYCARYPDVFDEWCRNGGPGDPSQATQAHAGRLAAAMAGVAEEAGLMRALRQERNRALAALAWLDIAGRCPLDEMLNALSAIADTQIETALRWLNADLDESWGQPRAADGGAQQLVVIAMGKLGASELNFSSDIDLIFAYPEDGETRGGRRTLSNQEFFNRLGKRLVRALDDVTADGFAYRVDMRLRPFGDSGPLAMSFGAMLGYYEAHAREWERYAMIKARIAAGDKVEGARLLEDLRPFVYRRYLDFGALESLREMKSLIAGEIARQGLEDDIKRGPGGIREIEFIAQAFQLIRGGREPALRERRVVTVLDRLAALGHLPRRAAEELSDAYRFLRLTENRLQQIDDCQTHALPGDPENQARLALGLDLPAWPAALAAIDRHRRRVCAHFEALLANEETPRAGGDRPWLWEESLDAAAIAGEIGAIGYDGSHREAVASALMGLRDAPALRRMGAAGQARLRRLVPQILQACAALPQPVITLERIFEIVQAIGSRSVYFSLLSEHPSALERLARLCAASPWVADQIGHHPLLLDQLLDPRLLNEPPRREDQARTLAAALDKFPGDLENAMESLRQFKHAQVLRVAAADISGALPVAEVSNRLSDIAEIVIEAALKLAWGHLLQRHGEPRCVDAGRRRAAGFAVIAYGKLGGLELGYGSDLDLVFVHSSRGEAQRTAGPKSTDNGTFFTRLGHRLIHLLQTLTPGGRAYLIDTRLRPSGESGLLVCALDAFREYAMRSAWTWEHQALIRARAVAGDPATREAFEAIRREVLAGARDPAELGREIAAMRRKMRGELSAEEAQRFDLKQGRGGITDIEFVVQYAVLRWASEHPQLLEVTDNLRQLERLARERLLDPSDCKALHDAYFAYRAEVHRRALQEEDAVVDGAAFAGHRAAVIAIWRTIFGEDADDLR
jgi:glutamate-ammonia-ligase adenylyltransferase